MDPRNHQNGFIDRSRRQGCDQFILFPRLCHQFVASDEMRNKKGIGKEKQLNQCDARFIVRTHMWGGELGGQDGQEPVY
jgi:hypothetical protein